MKKITAILLMSLFFAGCSMLGLQKPKSVCDLTVPGESVLCDIANDKDLRIETIGDLIALQNVSAIENGNYTTEDAIRFFEYLKSKLLTVDEIMVLDIALLAKQKIGKLGAAGYILLSPYIGYLEVPRILTDKDKEMLVFWCDYNIGFLRM